MSEYFCPHCKMPIYDQDALTCLYCGKNLRRNVGFLARLKYPNNRLFFFVAILLVLVSFIILIVL